MSILDELLAFRVALQRGQSLANPETWHDRATLIGTLQALLAALVAIANAFGWAVSIPPTDLASVSAGAVVIIGLLGKISDWCHTVASPEAGR